MDIINREEIEDCCGEEEEDSAGATNKLWCWEKTVGFVTATHAHPQGLFIHPHSWLALYPHLLQIHFTFSGPGTLTNTLIPFASEQILP